MSDPDSTPASCDPEGEYGAPDPAAVSTATGLRDGLMVCDAYWRITYVHPSAEFLVGVDGHLIRGQPLSAVLTPVGGNGAVRDWAWPELAKRYPSSHRHRVAVTPCNADTDQRLTCELFQIDSLVGLVLLHPEKEPEDSRRLAYLANHDALTGLPNRAAISNRLGLMHRTARIGNQTYGLLLLDLDHFKIINDRFGHATGDQVLIQVARRIPALLRDRDRIGRWGGEELLCLLPRASRSQALEIAERIRAGFTRPRAATAC